MPQDYGRDARPPAGPRTTGTDRGGWLGATGEVLDRAPQALLGAHARLVPEKRAGPGEVGPALLRVVRGARDEADLRRAAGQPDDRLGQLAHRHLVLGAAVDRPGLTGIEQRDDAAHQVVDVADRAGLRAGAVHGDRLAAQGLRDERRDGPAVVRAHARTVGVEDPDDADVEA